MTDSRVKTCSSCNAPIVWLLTKNLKHIPCDAASVGIEDTTYVAGTHVSHFATCPNASKHRKKGQ